MPSYALACQEDLQLRQKDMVPWALTVYIAILFNITRKYFSGTQVQGF